MSDNRFDQQALSFERAEHLPIDASGLSPDSRFTLRWKIPYGLAEEAKAWALESRRYISDVTVKFRSLPNTYRSLGIDIKANGERECYLDHSFAEGWITSLVSGTDVDYSEARLIDHKHLPPGRTLGTPVGDDDWSNPEDYHLIRWTGIDPALAEEIADSINALDADSFAPVINGEAIGSDFYRLYCRSTRDWNVDQPDKSATLDLLVAKPRFNLQCWTNYGTKVQGGKYVLYNVPKYIAQELINSYNQSVGASVNPGDENDMGLLNITIEQAVINEDSVVIITRQTCSDIVTTTYYYNVAAPIACPAASSGIYYDAQWQVNYSTGLWVGNIEKHELQTQTIPVYTQESSPADQTEAQEWINLRGTDGAYTDHDGNAVTLPDMAAETGKIKELRKEKTPYCTTNVNHRVNEPSDQVGHEYEEGHAADIERVTHTEGSELGAAPEVVGEINRHISRPTRAGNFATVDEVERATDQEAVSTTEAHSESVVETLHTQSSALAAASEVEGEIVRHENDPTRYGLNRTLQTRRIAKDQEAVSSQESHAESVTESLHTQGEDVGTAAEEAGKIISHDQAPTEYGKKRTVVRVREAKDQIGSEYEDRHDQSSEAVRHTQGDALTEPTAGDGEIVRRRSLPTEYGKNATEDVVISAKNQTGEETIRSAAEDTTASTETQGEFVVDVSAASGTVRRVVQRPTEFGKYAKTDSVTTPKDQTSSSAMESAAELMAAELHTQNPSEPSLPTGDGVIGEVDSQPTEVGNYRTRAVTRTAKNQTAAEYELSHAESIERATETQGEVEPTPSAPAAGTILRVSQQPTEFGKYRKAVETREAIDQSTSEYEESHAEEVARSIHTQGSELADPGAPAEGTIVRRTQSPTDYGKFRTADEVRTAKNQETAEYEKSHAESVVRDIDTQGDEELPPSDPAPGVIVRVSQQPTEYGKYRKAVETRSAVDQETTEYDESHAESVEREIHTQGTELADPGDPAAGTILRRSQSPTEFGKFRTADELRTAKNQTTDEYEESHAESVSRAIETQGDEEAAPAAPAAGMILSVSQAPTEYGKFRKAVEERTAKDQLGAGYLESLAESAVEAMHTQGDALSAPAETVGQIIEASIDPTPFGKNRTSLRVRTAKDQTETEYVETHAVSAETELHTQGDSVADPGSPSPGTTITVRQSPTPFGKVSSSREVRVAKDQLSNDYVESHAESVERSSHTQGEEVPDPGDPAVGTIVAVSQQPTEFGKTQSSVEVRTAKDQSSTSTEESHAESVAETLHTQNDDIGPAPEVDGAIVEHQQAPTDFGKNRTIARVRTAKNQTELVETASHAETAVEELETQNEDPLTTVSPALGQIIEQASDPTPFGRHRTVKRTRTAINQAGSGFEDSAAEAVAIDTATQDDAVVTDASTVGTIVEGMSRPTQFGKYDNTHRVRTAKDQTAISTQDAADQSVEDSLHTHGSDLGAALASPGVKIEHHQEPTPFGTVRNVARTITAKDQTTTSATDAHHESAVEVLHTQGEDIGTPTAAEGTIVEHAQRPTDFGKVNSVATVRTAKDQLGGDYEESAARSVVTVEHTQGDALTAPSPVVGSILIRSNTPTPYGKNRTVDRIVTPKSQTSENDTDTHHVSTAVTDTTETSPGPAPVAGVGETAEVSNIASESGLTRRVTTIRTAKGIIKTLTWYDPAGKEHRRIWGLNQAIGTCDTYLASFDTLVWDIELGGFDVNEFGLEDFTISAVEVETGYGIPTESEEVLPGDLTYDWHYFADTDEWYVRTIYSCMAYKVEDSYTGIKAWRDNKLQYGVTAGGYEYKQAHIVQGGHITQASFLNGTKAYECFIHFKAVGPWDYSSTGPDSGVLMPINEGSIE